MKKQTFVEILNSIQKWHDRSEKFGEAVADAYVDAGGEPDFVQPYAYQLLPGRMIDELVHAVAQDFETPQYSAEHAEDIINWWMWDCEFGSKIYHVVQPTGDNDLTAKIVEAESYVMEINGNVFICSSSDVLYDAIMYEQSLYNNTKN